MKILYIAGYGRSGSTILDIILGNHSQIVSTGEVNYLLDDWQAENRVCSCGKPYNQCEFWKDFFHKRPSWSREKRLVRKIEHLPYLPFLWWGLVPVSERETYRSFQRELFDYIASRGQAQKSIVLDSSKSAPNTTGRALALKEIAGLDVFMIHLVRGGLATLDSMLLTGSNRAIEGYSRKKKPSAFRTTMVWMNANISAWLVGKRLGVGRYMFLRYEDFIAEPETVLQSIGEFGGFDAQELVEKVRENQSFLVGHIVGGNRVRFQKEILLRRDYSWIQGERLMKFDRVVFNLLGGWLDRKYGYNADPGIRKDT